MTCFAAFAGVCFVDAVAVHSFGVFNFKFKIVNLKLPDA